MIIAADQAISWKTEKPWQGVIHGGKDPAVRPMVTAVTMMPIANVLGAWTIAKKLQGRSCGGTTYGVDQSIFWTMELLPHSVIHGGINHAVQESAIVATAINFAIAMGV